MALQWDREDSSDAAARMGSPSPCIRITDRTQAQFCGRNYPKIETYGRQKTATAARGRTAAINGLNLAWI